VKRTAILGLFIVIYSICQAQITEKTTDYRFHQHKGFYLSMSLGPNIMSIGDKVPGSFDYNYSGTGAQFDLKIGGAVSENLILHATLISNSLARPTFKTSGVVVNATNNVTIGEAMLGAGMTYYAMPANILLSGSVGVGNFTMMDNNKKNSVSTGRGFSMQLKVGKEWWISRRLGIGAALTYGKTTLTYIPEYDIEEMMNSNNIGIVLNASLH